MSEEKPKDNECLKCGHKWTARKIEVIRCPRCLSRRYWLPPVRGDAKKTYRHVDTITIVKDPRPTDSGWNE
jgi:DNA-directed RNA polymerase subunit RPC12/RpoP